MATTPSYLSNPKSPYYGLSQKDVANGSGIARAGASTVKQVQSMVNTPKATTSTVTESSGGGSDYDYADAMMSLIQAQYQAQENARKAKLEAIKKANDESASRQIGLYNNQANRNNKQISNLTKGGTNGAMLSSQLQNNLWRDNGIHNTINTRDTANANEESASYDTQANNLYNTTSLLSSVMSNLDTDSRRKLITKLEDIYR